MEGAGPVRLLVSSNEVCSQRIRFPEADDFRRVCQLIGIPFREDKRAGVFSVYPPLAGGGLMVDLVASGKERRDRMYPMFQSALRQVERLLWIAGATATTRDIDPMTGCSPTGSSLSGEGQQARPDARVLIYPGAMRPRTASPSIAYPWWPLPLRGRHLAIHLAAACNEFAHFRMNWGLAWGLSSDVGAWLGECVRAVPAPTVLVAIPMVDGYVDILLENIALVICQGIMGSFHEPYLDTAVCREIMNDTGGAGGAEASAVVAPEPEGAAPDGVLERSLPERPIPLPVEPKAAAPLCVQQPAPEPAQPLPEAAQPPARQPASAGGHPVPSVLRAKSVPRPSREVAGERQAREFLAAQGIEPSSDLVDEYLLFLGRFPQG